MKNGINNYKTRTKHEISPDRRMPLDVLLQIRENNYFSAKKGCSYVWGEVDDLIALRQSQLANKVEKKETKTMVDNDIMIAINTIRSIDPSANADNIVEIYGVYANFELAIQIEKLILNYIEWIKIFGWTPLPDVSINALRQACIEDDYCVAFFQRNLEEKVKTQLLAFS